MQKVLRQFGDNDMKTRIDSNSRASKAEPQSKCGRQKRSVPPPSCSPPFDASYREGTAKYWCGSTPSPRRDPPGAFAEEDAHGFSGGKTGFEGGGSASCSSSSTSESGREKMYSADNGHGDSEERGKDDMPTSCWDARGASRDRRPISDISHPRWQTRERPDVIDSGEDDVLSGARMAARREGWGEERRYQTDPSSTSCHPEGWSHEGKRRQSSLDRGGRRNSGRRSSLEDSRGRRKDAWSEGENTPGRGDAIVRLDSHDKDTGPGDHRRWHIGRRSSIYRSFLSIGIGRGFAEAWGSETTATPSPRAPGGGSLGKIGGGVTGGGVVWLGGPTDAMVTTSRRRGPPAGKRRSRVYPSNLGVCHGSSTSSSLATAITIAPREGGRLRGGSVDFGDSEAGVEAEPEADEHDICVSGRECDMFERTADRRDGRAGGKAELLLPSSDGAGRGDGAVARRNRREEETSLVVPERPRGRGQDENDKKRVTANEAASRRSSGQGESKPADRTTENPRDGRQHEERLSYSAWGQSGGKAGKGGGRGVHRPAVDEMRANLSKRRGVHYGEGQVERKERSSDRCLESVSSDEANNSWQQRSQRKPSDGGGNGGGEGGKAWESAESDTGAIFRLLRESTLSRTNNFLMMSYNRGPNLDMVQCIVVRDRSGPNRFYPQYSFFLDGHEGQLVMMAHKCRKKRTSNYHVFDMQRGGFEKRLSKKNGNYMGKVRTNLKRTKATMFTNDQKVAELGAIAFEKPGLVGYVREGSQPRRFSALLQALDTEGVPVSHEVDPFDADSDLLSRIRQGSYGSTFPLKTREPTFTRGNYRLNFHGRVTVPSVKNFQLISPDDETDTVCQFGKVGKDRFHLDYRSPINAFQAFCISLAQFNF